MAKKDPIKRIFVTNFPVVLDGAQVEETICWPCLSNEERALIKKSDDDAFQVWEEYSDGWTGSPVCDRCKLSIPVYVDGEQPSKKGE